MKWDVFISYEKTTGLSYAINLKEALKKAEVYGFVADVDIPKGTPWSKTINEAIHYCTYFIVIMNILAIRSEQVRREIRFAEKLNKDIIPCKPRTVDRFITSMLPVVSELQQIDFDVKEDLADQVVTIITNREQEKVDRSSIDVAKETELSNVQAAVLAMMVNNNLTRLPNPVTIATNDMGAFPDAISVCGIDKISDPNGNAYIEGADKNGFILYQHDITGDAARTGLVNYIFTEFIKGTYTVDASGTVTQVTSGYE